MSLSRFAIPAAVFVAVGSVASAAEHWVFLGTYTGGKDGSKGIYRCKFDDATGKLSEAEVAAEMASPSFITIHPNKKYLYAVGEGGGKDGGPVVAFALDAKKGTLTKLNEDKSSGPGPCHVVGPKGACRDRQLRRREHLRVRGGGDGKPRGGFFSTGNSKDRPAEGTARAAARLTRPAITLHRGPGIDKIKVFHIGAKGVEEEEDEDVATPAGSGPRHMAFHPVAKTRFYVCGELDSTVNFVKSGKVAQSLSTLPKATPGNSTAECIVSPDGKHVYVSNRGHNSIAVFRVDNGGMLEAAGHITGDIKTPRNFNIDPSGKWMLIASQDGGKVGVWELDEKGMGKETGDTVPVSSCVCVKFVPVAK